MWCSSACVYHAAPWDQRLLSVVALRASVRRRLPDLTPSGAPRYYHVPGRETELHRAAWHERRRRARAVRRPPKEALAWASRGLRLYYWFHRTRSIQPRARDPVFPSAASFYVSRMEPKACAVGWIRLILASGSASACILGARCFLESIPNRAAF